MCQSMVMQKYHNILIFCFFCIQFSFSQGFNMVKKGHILIPGQEYNDVWGYERNNGQKFAVAGTRQKTLIYNVTDCSNPFLVFEHTDGFSSIWRDYKTYGNAIYATADQSPYNQGLQVINMDTYAVTYYNTHFLRAHNIYVDTAHARLYVAGSNSVNAGLIVFDISNPLVPVHLQNIFINVLMGAPSLNTYVHDVYVKDNIAYTSNGSVSRMIELDVSDLNNVQILASYVGPSGYNHSSWRSEDGNYVYEALEVPKGLPINIYQKDEENDNIFVKIGDFKDPLEFPVSSTNRPHNPFVHENKLYISYYEDGVQVYDLSNPAAPSRIAYYDTYTANNGTGYGSSSSFHGCWGVYPFMSTGCILATDIETGFYTLELDLPQVSWNANVKTDQNFYQSVASKGVVLRSPKGYCFRLDVNNSGQFILTRIVCQSNTVDEKYIYRADLSVTGQSSSFIAKSQSGSCYKISLSANNQISGVGVSCPAVNDAALQINNSNLIIDTPTKGLVLYNSLRQKCVRFTVTDAGTFVATELTDCP